MMLRVDRPIVMRILFTRLSASMTMLMMSRMTMRNRMMVMCMMSALMIIAMFMMNAYAYDE